MQLSSCFACSDTYFALNGRIVTFKLRNLLMYCKISYSIFELLIVSVGNKSYFVIDNFQNL